MNYMFAQLDPRPVGADANEAIFAGAPAGVFGIEVTIPALASRCVVNLDHHGVGDTAETPSACEQAMVCELPPEGATLATVRPDADSVTAMAVIHIRMDRLAIDADIVSAVGRFDRLGPSAGKPSAVVTAIARKACDFKLPLEARVQWVSEILAGDSKETEVAELVSAHDRELEAAREASEIKVVNTFQCLVCTQVGTFIGGFGAIGLQCPICNSVDTKDLLSIVTVVSTHRFATTLGYEMAQVVIAQNPAMAVDFKDVSKGTYNKYTVCRYDSHVKCDLPAALLQLQALEPGWGGRGDIFGSPQGVSSVLTLDQVVEVVSRYLK